MIIYLKLGDSMPSGAPRSPKGSATQAKKMRDFVPIPTQGTAVRAHYV